MDGINETLNNHGSNLTTTIANQGWMIQNRLDGIHKGILENNRRNRWGRATFVYTAGAKITGAPNGPFIQPTPSLVVPKNEFWILRSFPFTSNVITPEAFLTIENQGRQLIWASKQNTSSLGGDSMALPGEEIIIGITAAEANQMIWGSLVYERVIIGEEPVPSNQGPKGEVLAGRNTHEPTRDQIMTMPGPRENMPHEIINTDGKPPLVDSGVDPNSV